MCWSFVIPLVSLPSHPHIAWLKVPRPPLPHPLPSLRSLPPPWLHTPPSSNTTTLLLLIFHLRTIIITIIIWSNKLTHNHLIRPHHYCWVFELCGRWGCCTLYRSKNCGHRNRFFYILYLFEQEYLPKGWVTLSSLELELSSETISSKSIGSSSSSITSEFYPWLSSGSSLGR